MTAYLLTHPKYPAQGFIHFTDSLVTFHYAQNQEDDAPRWWFGSGEEMNWKTTADPRSRLCRQHLPEAAEYDEIVIGKVRLDRDGDNFIFQTINKEHGRPPAQRLNVTLKSDHPMNGPYRIPNEDGPLKGWCIVFWDDRAAAFEFKYGKRPLQHEDPFKEKSHESQNQRWTMWLGKLEDGVYKMKEWEIRRGRYKGTPNGNYMVAGPEAVVVDEYDIDEPRCQEIPTGEKATLVIGQTLEWNGIELERVA